MDIVIDLDGCLFNIIGVMESHFKTTSNFDVNNIFTYDFNKSLSLKSDTALYKFFSEEEVKLIKQGKTDFILGVSHDKIMSCLKNPLVYSLATYSNSAVHIIRKLSKTNNIIFNSLVLPCGDSSIEQEIVDIKTKRIQKLMMDCKYSINITVGNSKEIVQADFIIEDSLQELNKYINTSAYKYLVRHSYNKKIFNGGYYQLFNTIEKIDTFAGILKDIDNKLDLQF